MTTQQFKDNIDIPFDATDNECWLWKGHVETNGYGKITHDYAHVKAWSVWRGPVPDKICVLHKCDNRLCINPNHLFLGSKRANNRDKALKNKQFPKRILTQEQYKEMVLLKQQGYSYASIARQFNILRGHCWALLNNSNGYNNFKKISS